MSSVGFAGDAHVARVHLNRPSALNAIDQTMQAAPGKAWAAINGGGIAAAIMLRCHGWSG
jgi:enoyl-CoA hydratase/carnithine racemase